MGDRRFLIIVSMLILTIFVSWGFYFYVYQEDKQINLKAIPLAVDGWEYQDLPIESADAAVLETKNAVLRRYTDENGNQVKLYIVYSQSNLKATNPPEIVYKGSGISIIDKGRKYLIISSSNLAFEVNWLLLEDNNNWRLAYYWYKVGDVNTHSYWKERVIAAYNIFMGKKTGSALIRISADMIKGQREKATDLINKFACLIIPQLIQQLP